MVPSLRNRQKPDKPSTADSPKLKNSSAKRVSESKKTTPRKRIKKEDVDNDSDAKENKSTNKEKKPKGKESVKTDAAHDKSSKNDTEYRCWLMKAEPDSRIVKDKDVKFSIDDLKAMPNSTSQWDGVRSFEARNIMRDRMKVGHQVLFYHSNCKQPGVAGIAEVVREGYVDYTAFDEKHPYFDPKSDESNPKWYMVDVKFVRKLKRLIPLKELQSCKELSDMVLIRRGRLSVQPVKDEEFKFILNLEDKDNETK
ncbi:hypothetical protein Unana1_02140 [Umbelopsis nana]